MSERRLNETNRLAVRASRLSSSRPTSSQARPSLIGSPGYTKAFQPTGQKLFVQIRRKWVDTQASLVAPDLGYLRLGGFFFSRLSFSFTYDGHDPRDTLAGFFRIFFFFFFFFFFLDARVWLSKEGDMRNYVRILRRYILSTFPFLNFLSLLFRIWNLVSSILREIIQREYSRLDRCIGENRGKKWTVKSFYFYTLSRDWVAQSRRSNFYF